MVYSDFLDGLLSEGRCRVPTFDTISEEDIRRGNEILVEYERTLRADLPSPLPNFDLEAAQWAAQQFFRACQFFLIRDADALSIQQALDRPYTKQKTAGVIYSVDFTFRFLPDLYRLSKAAAANDPLVNQLMKWGKMWPLSSVGIVNLEPDNIDLIAEDAGLLKMYVDLIVTFQDATRVADPRVKNMLAVGVGSYWQLLPTWVSNLQTADGSLQDE